VRDELLTFLKNDSETRGSTILCMSVFAQGPTHSKNYLISKDATHIYDGLNDFPTHVAHMRLGSFVTPPTPWPVIKDSALAAQFPLGTPLFKVALQWLREDKAYREKLENQGLRKTRGRRIEVL
jgi:CCR4-NOT complex subunit CAF16